MRTFQKLAIYVTVLIAVLGAVGTQVATSSALREISTSFGGGSLAADDVIANYNSETAYDTTVYQQQVSALWANKDLLKVIADQTAHSNAIGEAVVASNVGQMNTQVATNWLLAALVIAVAAFGFAIVPSAPLLKKKKETAAEPAAE
jgi:hypothetical protein